jgi:hypothetical protein
MISRFRNGRTDRKLGYVTLGWRFFPGAFRNCPDRALWHLREQVEGFRRIRAGDRLDWLLADRCGFCWDSVRGDRSDEYPNAGVQLLINSDYKNDMETNELFASEIMPRFA